MEVWESVVRIGIVLFLCSVLASITYMRKLLTLTGSVSAFGVGVLIGVFGDVVWLILFATLLI